MTDNSPLLNDILNQPQSLAETLAYHGEAGRATLYAAANLLKGQRIVFSGMGSSHFACYALNADLAAYGIATTVIDTAELLHYHTRAHHDAVVVLVSRSGESIETLKVLPQLKAHGTRVIGVTDVADSPLAREADLAVLLHGGQDHLVAVQSYTATLTTLHLLGAALTNTFDAARTELDAATKGLSDYVSQCFALSAERHSFFDGQPPIYLLGRGRSLASIYEGALLFNEVAKYPSAPMQAAQFRHGPLEIVDDAYRAIVFAADDHTRELNLALARDIDRLGGRTRLIGPPEADRAWWPTPQVAPSLAPLIEIIPVQCAALRLAERRGLVPGEFRVVTQITRSETDF